MSTDPARFKLWLDDLLREWLKANPYNVGPSGMWGWIKRDLDGPRVILPFHRMKALPPPFTISEQDRNGRTG